ncbi:YczE/YyaS/YitT family protein [Paenibacillus sp. CGMCC 1.18879]|uniref:YczE/YyaS/YitT family protein n=1 Tax=Paenibacillus sp. CGMCC 1.18879 TaxID=2834466 RepID=UPI001CA8096F|nr:YitT family protein [Paenibacillus sp. CGMCC 1.18879]MBY9077768.1 YitT family protein [Paenibacillus sp. CGMCC 1.18879]
MIKLKRTAIYLIGFNILILGISFLIISTYGQSAWDGVYVAISKIIHISVGLATFICAVGILLVCYILTKDWYVFLSFITSVVQSLLIDFYLVLVKTIIASESISARIFLFTTGIILMSIGCSIYIQAKYPTNHVDCLMLSISRRFKLNLRKSKLICDSSAILITLIIARRIALGTFIVLISLSPLIQFISDRISRPIDNFINSSNSL